MEQATLKSQASGPRWLRFDVFLRDACFDLGLKHKIERETTFMREHVRYEITGPVENMKALAREINRAIAEYEKEIEG